MVRRFLSFFDKLEDFVRHGLSKRPVAYALISGFAIVLFWRGVWHLADEYGMTSWESLVVSVVLMLLTGTFVSFFIGEQILISGLREEKRIDQKTEEEVQNEDRKLRTIYDEINQIREDVDYIKKHLTSVPLRKITKEKKK